YMFMITGALGIAVAIGWYLYYRDRRSVELSESDEAFLNEGSNDIASERKLSINEWRGLFLKRTTWGMIFGNAGIIYMLWLFLTWMPAYLERERNLPLAEAGWIVSI